MAGVIVACVVVALVAVVPVVALVVVSGVVAVVAAVVAVHVAVVVTIVATTHGDSLFYNQLNSRRLNIQNLTASFNFCPRPTTSNLFQLTQPT